MTPRFFDNLDRLVRQGELGHLSWAFTRFVVEHGNYSPSLVLACVALIEMEGRGHSCLDLSQLASAPCDLLEWPTERWTRLCEAAKLQQGYALPLTVDKWQQELALCRQVWPAFPTPAQGGRPYCGEPLVLDGERLYLRRYWEHERKIARNVLDRVGQEPSVDTGAVRNWLDRMFPAVIEGSPDWQKIACANAVRRSFSIITGGPGTGKTYTVARLLVLLFALADAPQRMRVALAAPTGKAAARLKQSLGNALKTLPGDIVAELHLDRLAANMAPPATLHSLLGAHPDRRTMRRHAGNPLDLDVLIVDEASMVDLEMMAALLDALPPQATLVLLGDKDQLASVEAGAVLGDMCQSAEQGGYSPDTAAYLQAATGSQIPQHMIVMDGAALPLAQQTVMLRQSQRFVGMIGKLAAAVNAGDEQLAVHCLENSGSGELALLRESWRDALLDLALNGRDGAGGVSGSYGAYLRELQDIPSDSGPAYQDWVRKVLEAFDSFRILCAIRDGDFGVAGINQALEHYFQQHRLLNPGSEWYIGRPVMVTRNDYGAGVFNGDIGITLPDPKNRSSRRVYFLEGNLVRSVLASRLSSVETAFAMTVHKSQGSEFRHVVLVLPPSEVPVLTRELVYTGLTRTKEAFTLVAPAPELFVKAIRSPTQRASGLRSLFRAGVPSPIADAA